MRPSTNQLLQRAGIRTAMDCLEAGCGGGDVAFDLARMVGPSGTVVGIDIDETKLELARREAAEQQLGNLEFRREDITEMEPAGGFDLIHARFLLTHLARPGEALARFRKALRPGGVIVIEDIDFRGHFCHPDHPAFWRYVELYTAVVSRRGGDANIGPRLPSLLRDAGFENIQVNVVQPVGAEGDAKLMGPITMENIADAVVSEGLAPATEVHQIVEQLYDFARTPGSLLSLPRIVEAWGYQTRSA